MMWTRTAWLTLGLSAACAEPHVNPDQQPTATDCFAADDITFDFETTPGEVWSGELSLTNRCDTPQVIGLQTESEVFRSDGMFATVAANDAIAIPLEFMSTAPGEFNGMLTFGPPDEGPGSAVAVPFAVTVYGSRLGVVDINAREPAPAGCAYVRSVRLINHGNMPLMVSNIEVDTDQIELSGDAGAISIAAGAQYILGLQVRSDRINTLEATLSMTTDAFQQERVTHPVQIETTYQNPTSTTAEFDSPKLDILLVMDRSTCNMDQLETMPEEIDHLRTSLDGLDYRAMVTAGDAGCILGDEPFVDASTAADDATSILRTMTDARYELAPLGRNAERHFTLAKATLENADDCNAGTFREDAFLHIIYQSDEPEQSEGRWQDYLAWTQTHTDGRVLHHAVGGPAPSGCASASTSWGLWEVVEESGGIFRDICETEPGTWRPAWGAHFEAFGEAMKRHADYRLALEPAALPDTLELKINGTATTEGWSINETGDVITIDASRALSGADVQVDYQAAPEVCP